MRGGKIKSYPHDSKSTHRPTLRAQSSKVPRRRRLTSDWEGCRGGGLHSAGKHYVRQENHDYYRKKKRAIKEESGYFDRKVKNQLRDEAKRGGEVVLHLGKITGRYLSLEKYIPMKEDERW